MKARFLSSVEKRVMETQKKGREYQNAVITVGLATWLMALANLLSHYPKQDQLEFLFLVPVIIAVGMSPQRFRLPLGFGFSREKVSFTLSDAIVVLVACWYGFSPAVLLAGIEGFTSSRRTAKR
ncbi:MAG TPA: hypothetical protein VID27_08635, partial [Blastocatellia bacterium]